MEQDINNLNEIINLCNEELDNKDENVTAVLDLTDLLSLRNLIKAYKELEEENTEVKECLEVTSKALDNVAYDQIPIAIADLMIPKALVEEKILNPMKEEHDKAIKGFIKRDILVLR